MYAHILERSEVLGQLFIIGLDFTPSSYTNIFSSPSISIQLLPFLCCLLSKFHLLVFCVHYSLFPQLSFVSVHKSTYFPLCMPSMAISDTVSQLLSLLTWVQQRYHFSLFYLSRLHISLCLLYMFCYLSVVGLCVTLCCLFLLFIISIPVLCLSLFCRFSSCPYAIFLSICIFLICCFLPTCFSSELCPHFLAFSRTLFLSPFVSICIACLRAHGCVRRAPPGLTQCSLLPASICRSSGPHRSAQRAGWGAGERQSLPEPAQDWISGYTHTHMHACTTVNCKATIFSTSF